MNTTPPEWFQIAGPLTLSTLTTVAIFWQPRWIHRLFGRLVSFIDGLSHSGVCVPVTCLRCAEGRKGTA